MNQESNEAESEDASTERRVFVVYGRNLRIYEAILELLGEFGLKAIRWNDAIYETRKAAPHATEVVEEAFRRVRAVIVLFAPEEEATLTRQPTILEGKSSQQSFEPRMQPRPNVLFEAGRAFGAYPDSTLIVKFGDCDILSDLHGISYIEWSDSTEFRREIANRLLIAGCPVISDEDRWLEAGNFSAGWLFGQEEQTTSSMFEVQLLPRGTRIFHTLEIYNRSAEICSRISVNGLGPTKLVLREPIVARELHPGGVCKVQVDLGDEPGLSCMISALLPNGKHVEERHDVFLSN